MEKDSVIYYKRWAKIASQMDDRLRLILFDTLNSYVLDGTLPEEDSPVYWVFLLMLEQLKVDEKRYEEISAKRKALSSKSPQK